MEKYHKIQTVYLRDHDNKYRTLLEGQFARPEFKYLYLNRWLFTEKIDGTNIRINWNPSVDEKYKWVEFGGRTDKAQIPTFLYDKLQELFPVDKFLALYPDSSMTLYGEGYGARIQKGGGNYIPDGVDFILFDVMINDHYLERANVEDIAARLGIKAVTIVGSGTLYDAVEMTREGFQSHIGTQIAEGLVMCPVVELQDRLGKRIITKIKYKDFER